MLFNKYDFLKNKEKIEKFGNVTNIIGLSVSEVTALSIA